MIFPYSYLQITLEQYGIAILFIPEQSIGFCHEHKVLCHLEKYRYYNLENEINCLNTNQTKSVLTLIPVVLSLFLKIQNFFENS